MRHVEPTPSGRFKVRFRHGGKQTSETFATRKKAEQFAQWLDALGAQGALDHLYAAEQDATVPTLDALCADHIEHLTGVESGTRKTYTRLWARTWGPRIGHLPANRIGRDVISRAVNDLAEHYSHKSLENQRGLLAGVLSRAVELGYLPKNPAKGIRLPRGQEGDRVDMRIITPDEFAIVIQLIPENYRPLVRFLYGTGCRWGEAVALTVADLGQTYVDPSSGQPLRPVRIRRSLKWSPDNDRRVGATKTKRSNRTVVVGDVMLDDLAAAAVGKKGTDLVFTAPRGGAILHRTFWSRAWLPAVSHLEPRPRIHDLRHSHASWLLAQGVPIHVVQMRLGHESIQTTVDTYGHLLPDAQRMAAHAASMAFGATPRAIG
jgi:Site-specific recombinase XerD